MSTHDTTDRVTRWLLMATLMVPALALATHPSPRLVALGVIVCMAIGATMSRSGCPSRAVQLPLAALSLALALGALTAIGGEVRPQFGHIISVGALALALPRLWWRDHRVGHAITLGLGLLALMGLSRTLSKPMFSAALAWHIVMSYSVIRRTDPTWAPLRAHPWGATLPLVLALALAGGVATGFGVALPAATPAVTRALQPYLFPDTGAAGLGGDHVQLGHLRQILTSDRVALRVHGDADYLRARAYNEYWRGRWRSHRMRTAPITSVNGRLTVGAGSISTQLKIEQLNQGGRAVFLPRDAVQVSSLPDHTTLDAYGVVRASQWALDEPRTYVISRTKGERSLDISPPTAKDTSLPRTTRTQFEALAGALTEDGTTPRVKVNAIATHLMRTLRYSLTLDPSPPGVDPTLYFLETSRRGHCEFFASALVLLARAEGIPARLVTGARVLEYNAAGGYALVRDRDAHAWTEIFLDGAWETMDPTPPGALGGRRTTPEDTWAAWWDVVKRALGGTFEWLADLSMRGRLLALAGVALLGLGWVRLRRRGLKAEVVPDHWAPLKALEAHMDAQGFAPRAPAETLSGYADALEHADAAHAAHLLRRIGALRYGQHDDEAALSEAIQKFVSDP